MRNLEQTAENMPGGRAYSVPQTVPAPGRRAPRWPQRIHAIWIGVALLAATAGMASGLRLAEANKRIQQLEYAGSLRLSPGGDGARITVPAQPLTQRLELLGTLVGINLTVALSAGDTGGSYRLVVRAPDQQIVSERVFKVPPHNGLQTVRIDTSPISSKVGEVYFTLEPENYGASSLQLPLAHPTPTPSYLRAVPSDVRSVVFEPVYAWTTAMRWRTLLLSQAYVIIGGAALVVFVLWRLNPIAAATAGFAVMMVYSALGRYPYSVVDENGHVAYVGYAMEHMVPPLTTMVMPNDVLNEIRKSVGKVDMPMDETIPFYEAVQGPLYYQLCAAVAKVVLKTTRSWAFAFYAVRVFGALIVSVGFYFVGRTGQLLVKSNMMPVVAKAPLLMATAVGTVMFCPGILSVLSTITNDQLAFTLGSAVLFQLVRAACQKSFSTRDIVVLGVLCGALWITKLTGALLFGVCLIYLLGSGYWLGSAAFVGTVALMVVPLHAYYWQNYQALTGIGHQIEFVRHIVNPEEKFTPFADVVVSAFDTYFVSHFYSNAYHVVDWQVRICQLIVVLPLVGALAVLLLTVRNAVRDFRRTFTLAPTKEFLCSFMTLGCLAPFLMCCLGSYDNQIDLSPARFGYPCLICFVAVFAWGLDRIRPKVLGRWLAIAIVLAMLVVSITFSANIRPI